jgi:uncharacterized membrane protein
MVFEKTDACLLAIGFSYLGVIFLYYPLPMFMFIFSIMFVYLIIGREVAVITIVTTMKVKFDASLAQILVGISGIVFVDVIVGVFLLISFDALKEWRLIGKYIRLFENKGKKLFKRKPHLKRFTASGLLAIHCIPIHGTGGISTTAVGRIIGLNKYLVFGIVITGSLISCYVYAAITIWGIERALEVAGYYIVPIVAVIIIIFLLTRLELAALSGLFKKNRLNKRRC